MHARREGSPVPRTDARWAPLGAVRRRFARHQPRAINRSLVLYAVGCILDRAAWWPKCVTCGGEEEQLADMATNERFQHLLEGAINASYDKKLKDSKRVPRKVRAAGPVFSLWRGWGGRSYHDR